MAKDEAGARLAADLKRYGRALGEAGLEELGSAALKGEAPAEQLADLYELLLVRTLLRTYLGGDGAELGRIGGLTLARARESFTRLDKELHELEAKAIVAKRLGDKPPLGVGYGRVGDFTEMELLDHELALKKSRTPLRDVAHRAGAALQALKPVWMMSPTSAAQYIRPATLTFDLLVVDEASQMRPEYSISSVMRGGQFVVVGDANQLPPSDHFKTGGDDGADDDAVGVTQDTESILDLANQRFRRKRRLKWHYRSQHESLIQFSNREFYESELVVFPSPMGNDDELLGVKCRYVDGAVYEASINQREAEAVIEEAFRLMRAYPQHSLGIAAMNAKQTELIQNEFDRLILEQPEIRRYIDEYAGGVEEFFIKNLENVQGDERDIILISTVYGPNKDGKVLQNFGLMNREVGWRRLNVLVTRAKRSTRLFTSLRPDDVKVTPTSSRGVRTLKAYLTYAHGGASYQDRSGGEPDSDFEVFVADALASEGYEVVHQVGVEGFRIDLGVRHPDYPIGFIAGVECDGASFHRGLTVRDRDRIRQSVLEGMGWKIYRIWSTDWFGDPARELSRLFSFLEEQRATFADEYARRPKPSDDPIRGAPAPTPDEPAEAPPTPAGAATLSGAAERFEPTGRPMRPLGGITWYETVKGQLYEVWLGSRLAGDVEVLSRAAAAPRLYGNQMVVARSEYQGRIETSGERFVSHDIHAAVREVARKAQAAAEAVA
jgi:very-short-patch-repair endonuclease